MNINNEINVVKKQLQKEYKTKLKEQIQCTNNEILFIHEWLDDEDCIIGIGTDVSGKTKYMNLSINFALFVVSKNVELLKAICSVLGYSIEQTGIIYSSNTFSMHDLLFDEETARDCELVKINTKSYEQALNVYYRIKNDKRGYKKGQKNN